MRLLSIELPFQPRMYTRIAYWYIHWSHCSLLTRTYSRDVTYNHMYVHTNGFRPAESTNRLTGYYYKRVTASPRLFSYGINKMQSFDKGTSEWDRYIASFSCMVIRSYNLEQRITFRKEVMITITANYNCSGGKTTPLPSSSLKLIRSKMLVAAFFVGVSGEAFKRTRASRGRRK